MNWWHRLWRRQQMEDKLEKKLRFRLDQLMRRAARTSAAPTPTSRKIIPRLCRTTSHITSPAFAPSAMLTPISGTRWPVKYAVTP